MALLMSAELLARMATALLHLILNERLTTDVPLSMLRLILHYIWTIGENHTRVLTLMG